MMIIAANSAPSRMRPAIMAPTVRQQQGFVANNPQRLLKNI